MKRPKSPLEAPLYEALFELADEITSWQNGRSGCPEVDGQGRVDVRQVAGWLRDEARKLERIPDLQKQAAAQGLQLVPMQADPRLYKLIRNEDNICCGYALTLEAVAKRLQEETNR